VDLGAVDIERAAARRRGIEELDLDRLYQGRHTLVRRPGDIGREYVEFARNPQARIGFGYEWIDAVLQGGVAPGEVCTLVAGSNTGKTTFLANVGLNNPSIPMLFVSIEMPLILVAPRIFAMAEGEEFRTLERRIKGGDEDLARRVTKTLEEVVPRFGMMGVGAPSAEIVTRAIGEYESIYAERPKLVLIDYLDLMSPNSENVEAVKRKYVELRTMAKAEEVGVVVAHQIKREVLEGRHGSPLRFTDTRYAGEAESDHLVGLYRRVNDLAIQKAGGAVLEEYRWTIHAQVLKTRSGEPAGVAEGHEMGWNPRTLRVTDEPDLEPIKVPPRTALDVLATPSMFDGNGRQT